MKPIQRPSLQISASDGTPRDSPATKSTLQYPAACSHAAGRQQVVSSEPGPAGQWGGQVGVGSWAGGGAPDSASLPRWPIDAVTKQEDLNFPRRLKSFHETLFLALQQVCFEARRLYTAVVVLVSWCCGSEVGGDTLPGGRRRLFFTKRLHSLLTGAIEK
ncbi:hypothetical protein S7711_10876 [Stachybotrys chartarum IBT 7711]|uniref:Uncharacterized protein n=1 Tax=Stachybotrys chartarum (strain CBS 109288 / IBT 7711) TaxID=1280523 RepID=A0A084B615_STACB|nr:hypothetical protein S7711_10876 [Stachybotrys chartarum IBT 7711]